MSGEGGRAMKIVAMMDGNMCELHFYSETTFRPGQMLRVSTIQHKLDPSKVDLKLEIGQMPMACKNCGLPERGGHKDDCPDSLVVPICPQDPNCRDDDCRFAHVDPLSCPNCGKVMSEFMLSCSHCGFKTN